MSRKLQVILLAPLYLLLKVDVNLGRNCNKRRLMQAPDRHVICHTSHFGVMQKRLRDIGPTIVKLAPFFLKNASRNAAYIPFSARSTA